MKCTTTYNPSDQKETKFRFYYDKMTHPEKHIKTSLKKRPKKFKTKKKILKNENG